MTRNCPQCGLISPEEAARCDCGYDFSSRTLKASYLKQHVQRKQEDERVIVDRVARENLRDGLLLLGAAAILVAYSYAQGSYVSQVEGAAVWGGLFLYRGLARRRRRGAR